MKTFFFFFYQKQVSACELDVVDANTDFNITGIGGLPQVRSSLYANTQLRAHRCAEKKIKSKKNKKNKE
jgi:hypothetical protein